MDDSVEMRSPRERQAERSSAVHGVEVDPETRCRHWHGPRDVVALRLRCCGEWYACFDCHALCADHPPEVWPIEERHVRAVLCGVCSRKLTVAEYLSCESACPRCGAGFNPGCVNHYHLYFQAAKGEAWGDGQRSLSRRSIAPDRHDLDL